MDGLLGTGCFRTHYANLCDAKASAIPCQEPVEVAALFRAVRETLRRRPGPGPGVELGRTAIEQKCGCVRPRRSDQAERRSGPSRSCEWGPIL